MAVDGKHHPLETTFHLIILKMSFYQRLNDRARVKMEFRRSRDFCESFIIHGFILSATQTYEYPVPVATRQYICFLSPTKLLNTCLLSSRLLAAASLPSLSSSLRNECCPAVKLTGKAETKKL